MKNMRTSILLVALLCATTMYSTNGDTVVVGKDGTATMNPKDGVEEPSLLQRVGQFVEDKFGSGDSNAARSPVYGEETLQNAKDNITSIPQRVGDRAATGAAYVREKGGELADAIRSGIGFGSSVVQCTENDVMRGATYIKNGVAYTKDPETGSITRLGEATGSGLGYTADRDYDNNRGVVGNLAQGAGDQLKAGSQTVREGGSNIAQSAGDAVKTGASSVKDTVIGGVDTARAAVGSVGAAVLSGVDAAGRLMQGAGDSVRSGGQAVHDRMASNADSGADYIKSGAESAEYNARHGINNAQDTGRYAADRAGDTLHSGGQTLKEKGQTADTGNTGILGKMREAVENLI